MHISPLLEVRWVRGEDGGLRRETLADCLKCGAFNLILDLCVLFSTSARLPRPTFPELYSRDAWEEALLNKIALPPPRRPLQKKPPQTMPFGEKLSATSLTVRFALWFVTRFATHIAAICRLHEA